MALHHPVSRFFDSGGKLSWILKKTTDLIECICNQNRPTLSRRGDCFGCHLLEQHIMSCVMSTDLYGLLSRHDFLLVVDL